MSLENLPSPSKAIDWQAPIPWTWGLVCVLVGVHLATGVFEWWAGYESLFDALVMDRSIRMRVAVGGQLDLSLEQGEWFRLATSTLLHGDLLHLGVNAVALYSLGRIIEPLYGGFRCLVCFSFGAVVASAGSYLAGVLQSDGASGGASTWFGMAIMLGLLYRKQFDRVDARLLGPVLWVFVLLNIALGFFVPLIDGVGHAVGFVVGLLCGLWGKERGRWLERSGGVLWVSSYILTLGFGAWWVLSRMTVRRWASWFVEG